jgi:hypothetical protein
MKHSSGRVPTSPPVGFPLFGLDESWHGARWLDGFGDPVGDPPRWASLGHQSPAGDSRIVVTTHSRLATGTPRSFRIPTDARAAQMGRSLQYLAADAALQLTGMTLPVMSLARPPGFLQALVEYAEKAGSEYAQWPRVSWRVDGVAVTARVWWFAGGWAAFTDAVEGAYLTAVGLGGQSGGPVACCPSRRQRLPLRAGSAAARRSAVSIRTSGCCAVRGAAMAAPRMAR